MTGRYLALIFAGMLALHCGRAAAQGGPPTAAGLWQQIDEATGQSEGWFLIYDHAGIYDGAIAKMFLKPGDDPHALCTRCRDDRKDRPWLGLAIIRNMQRNGLRYENGTILDPRDGSIYNALMQLSPDGQTLTVRGYLGIALLGRNQIWHRLPDADLAQVDCAVIAEHAPALLPAAACRGAGERPQRPAPVLRGRVR